MGVELMAAAGALRSLAARALPIAVAVTALLSVAPPARAASLTFGTPSASSTFGNGIDFVQPVSGASGFKHVDLVVDYPGAPGPAATEVTDAAGSTLKYHLDTSQGQLVPNTSLTARWRVTLDDGTLQTGPDVSVTYADTRFSWKSKSGQLVRIHWYEGDDAFATRALQIGEQGVEKAASFMGATESKPIDFFVYADQKSFYDALGPGTRENVGGEAHANIRTLFALITPDQVNDSWVAVVIPHELTHVVFDDVVHNPYHDPPHWLNEGVAVYLTQGFDSSDRSAVSGAVRDGSLMPLAALRGQFPTVAERFSLGYSESVSAVDYLVRTFGRDSLSRLIKTYGSGVSDDAAFTAATGKNAAAFDAAWLASIGAGAPKQFGPAAAPAGPVPPGWTASGGGAPAGSAAPGGSAGPDSQASAAPEQTPDTSPASSTKQSGTAILAAFAVGLLIVVALGAFVVLRLAGRNERGSGG